MSGTCNCWDATVARGAHADTCPANTTRSYVGYSVQIDEADDGCGGVERIPVNYRAETVLDGVPRRDPGPASGGDPAEPPADDGSRRRRSQTEPPLPWHLRSRRVVSFGPPDRELVWLSRMLEVARLVATWSKDPSTKAGAVLMDSDHRILGTGYNGFPRGVADHPERYADRAVKYPMVVHAEANALVTALGHSTAWGVTLVVTTFPCARCAGLAIQAGVSAIACPDPAQDERMQRDPWKAELELASAMLAEAGVRVVLL